MVRGHWIACSAALVIASPLLAQSDREQQVDRITGARDSRERDRIAAGGRFNLLVADGEERPWSLTLGVDGGYDTNPDAAADARGGGYGHLFAEFAYVFALDREKKLSLTLAIAPEYVLYEGRFADSRELDQAYEAKLEYQASDSTKLSLVIDDTYVHVARDPFLNRLDVSPQVRHSLSEEVAIDLSYTYTNLAYLFDPSAEVRNPDADRHKLAVAFILVPKGALAGMEGWFKSVSVGYGHSWNEASGDDFDYEANAIALKIKEIRAWKSKAIWIDANYSHEWNDYQHPNSLSTSGDSRQDDVDRVKAQLNWKLGVKGSVVPTVFVRYEYVRQRSNLDNKTFDESIIGGGISFDF